ncbi:MAG: amidohydrolase family protein [Planctomycetota bacterium]
MLKRFATLFFAFCTLSLSLPVFGQGPVAADPIVGLRDERPIGFALVGANVVTRPGNVISDATVLIQGASILAVASEVEVPAGFKEIDCGGKYIYAGFIDAYSESDVPLTDERPAYWNGNVVPQRSSATVAAKEPLNEASELRSQGITARVVAPSGAIVRGTSCVVLLGSQDGQRLLLSKAWHHAQLTVPRVSPRPRYPNSPMGATALLRQALHDAQWYQRAWSTYRSRPSLPRPESNLALEVLADAIEHDTFVIDAQNERMAIRAAAIADEFALKWILRGSGREYRQLTEIAARKQPVLVPVDFPEAPEVESAEASRRTSLQELLHWDLAPENPARLHHAGLKICLTTDGLDDLGDFLSQVRVAVDRGLDGDDALAALTTQPATLLGLASQVGAIEPGMMANLVVCDGDLWESETDVEQTWIAGEPFVISDEQPSDDWLLGQWEVSFGTGIAKRFVVEFDSDEGKWSGKASSLPMPAAKDEKDEEDSSVTFKNVVRGRDRLTATVDLSELFENVDPGRAQLTIVTVDDASESGELFASVVMPDGQTLPMRMTKFRAEAISPSDEVPSDSESGSEEASDEDASEEDNAIASVVSPTLIPLGAYGLTERISEQPTVLFRGATVWTCDEQGKLEEADILVRDGLIVEVASSIDPPANCQVIDVHGKHITPGLIDCHSHMGTDGGVNESGQAVTAEVRIGDFIDNTDIHIYRHLAGGLTTSNILHGSANPIGGQNQVIKLRWGESMDGLRMKEAPAGIKFALGENVKRSTSRYPNTRMGVEQVIRDQLLAAREYQTHWRDWKRGVRDRLPPRVDLQLEALAEVQRGERWIHCHSYRQDEIVATLEVLEEFGVQIGTLQHILEGYKVADRMAQHGAMASAFSDWWAYKFEVYDAIPYNGALMHRRGVVVSFNSDDRELARHMNTEAAKATKYGGVPEQEALLFVTLNPAKQLRIDQYVGSITPGKHADLTVWSGRPLSTLTRCEQTWIDGRKYFDLKMDRELQARDADLKARLIQKALADGEPIRSRTDSKELAEEDRWDRHDAFCTAKGSTQYRRNQVQSESGGAK